ncbi:hypothetical protein Rsub_01974 [Raphidocelis subcapitata]|uniref:Uncharacterized protein n=1 Tax=Raphidocelis subcapitata TaxID=307507 RepID=A0A2V0NRX3_9CHLO|nr:hypothetical protein Rsub_01974 [Raphidocelis subcapitata]|eukprot:GBF89402.1 hypothetical protein Rsub_01974 [Raphidocelis subcapitata]
MRPKGGGAAGPAAIGAAFTRGWPKPTRLGVVARDEAEWARWRALSPPPPPSVKTRLVGGGGPERPSRVVFPRGGSARGVAEPPLWSASVARAQPWMCRGQRMRISNRTSQQHWVAKGDDHLSLQRFTVPAAARQTKPPPGLAPRRHDQAAAGG